MTVIDRRLVSPGSYSAESCSIHNIQLHTLGRIQDSDPSYWLTASYNRRVSDFHLGVVVAIVIQYSELPVQWRAAKCSSSICARGVAASHKGAAAALLYQAACGAAGRLARPFVRACGPLPNSGQSAPTRALKERPLNVSGKLQFKSKAVRTGQVPKLAGCPSHIRSDEKTGPTTWPTRV
jgi:hypothetical protein